jgi:putative SOS response-associated peptidase YedK
MCGRFVIAFTDGFHARFRVGDNDVKVTPRFNIAPSQDVPIVLRDSPNRLEMMHWGLIPSWSKAERTGLKLINARSESVMEKPMFKRLIGDHRCLVPATGFYEWMTTDEGKVPFYISSKRGDFLGFAGLFDQWHSPEGLVISSFTIITTAANELMNPIHDRMPVIVRPEDEDIWVERKALDPGIMRRILAPYPSEELVAHQVAKMVRNPGAEGPDLIRPVEQGARTVQMHL